MAANLVLGYFLLSPNNDKQKVEAVKQELSDKDKQIKSLQDSISKLKGDVVNEKEKAVDAKEKAVDAKEKAVDAERAKTEAEKKAQEERAKAEAKQQNKPADVATARKDVIAILGKASKLPKAKDRESLRVDAINKLNKLMSIDSAHKSEYNWCVAELKKPITLKDNGRGQYTACINKLNAIK